MHYLGLVEDKWHSILENSSLSRYLATREEKLFNIGMVCFKCLVTLLCQGVERGLEVVDSLAESPKFVHT
jgi:hypothetical protein